MFTNLALRGGVSGGLFSARARSACLLFVLFILFYSQGVAQLNLFDELAPRHNSARLMQVLDQLNAKNGRGALYFAGQGIQQQWQMKREMLSPRYTTRYGDLLRVR